MNPADLEIMDGQPDPDGLWELMNRETVEAALMFELDFRDEPMLLSNRLIPFTDNRWGKRWGDGAGMLVAMPDFDYDQDTIAPFREYGIGATWDMIENNDLFIAKMRDFITDRDNYWRRSLSTHIQYFDDGKPAYLPITRDISVMDHMSLSFRKFGMVVLLQVESLFGRMAVAGYGKLTYQHQKFRHPGDLGLQFNTEFDKLVTRTNF